MTLLEAFLLLFWAVFCIAVTLTIFLVFTFYFDMWCRKRYDWRKNRRH